ncbi:MAG: MucR family transcriptional regulator, partial [Sphingomonas sp.]
MQDGSNARRETLLALTADIVAAHVAGTKMEAAALPALIGTVHAALAGL